MLSARIFPLSEIAPALMNTISASAVCTQRSFGNKVADVGFKVLKYMLIAYKVNPGGPNRLI